MSKQVDISGAVDRSSKKLAVKIDRRGFMRKMGHRVFITTALLSAGGFAEVLRAPSAWAFPSSCESTRGTGCPGGGNWGTTTPCGPSRCCSHLGTLASGCNCSNVANGTFCKSGTTHCHGLCTASNEEWGASCWTCNSTHHFTCGSCTCHLQATCCDCNTSGCGDASPVRCGTAGHGVCISYTVSTIIDHCP
jgi:hypothetical protein